jgi:hypothetical protein
MMTSEKHSEQEEEKKQDDDQQPVSFTGRICGIGFAGGVFWSVIMAPPVIDCPKIEKS